MAQTQTQTSDLSLSKILDVVEKSLLYFRYDKVLLVRRVERYNPLFDRDEDVIEVVMDGGVVIEVDTKNLEIVSIHSLNICRCGGD